MSLLYEIKANVFRPSVQEFMKDWPWDAFPNGFSIDSYRRKDAPGCARQKDFISR
jgi:hypothetical protein